MGDDSKLTGDHCEACGYRNSERPAGFVLTGDASGPHSNLMSYWDNGEIIATMCRDCCQRLARIAVRLMKADRLENP